MVACHAGASKICIVLRTRQSNRLYLLILVRFFRVESIICILLDRKTKILSSPFGTRRKTNSTHNTPFNAMASRSYSSIFFSIYFGVSNKYLTLA